VEIGVELRRGIDLSLDEPIELSLGWGSKRNLNQSIVMIFHLSIIGSVNSGIKLSVDIIMERTIDQSLKSFLYEYCAKFR